MSRYRDDPRALQALVQDDRVHRDLYIDPEVFQLEMERLWSRTWIYVGHASQVPQAGDFVTLNIAAKPLILVRHTDGSVRVLMNRCAHKGTKVVYDFAGNTGKTFRCPYHAWTYGLDGRLVGAPHMDEVPHFRKEDFSLHRAHVDTWDGHLFLNVAPNPPTLATQLADLPTLKLPTDRPRPARFSFNGARCPVEISESTGASLTSLASNAHSSASESSRAVA